MGFLSDLKSQAQALQQQHSGLQHDSAANVGATERAMGVARRYLQDLCAQLNVIRPPAVGDYSLDAKTAFGSLVLTGFRCDARKKWHQNQEVFSHIGVGWDIGPAAGKPLHQQVSVNFPPDLERVTQRLSAGQVVHERKEVRHPDTQKLRSYVFEYEAQAQGTVMVTADHDKGEVTFRLAGVGGLVVSHATYPATSVGAGLLDELAKKLVGQPSAFGV